MSKIHITINKVISEDNNARVVKTLEINYDAIKPYQKTDIDKIKESADILVEYCNGGSFTISVKSKSVELKGRGVKTRYDNGNYEISTAKLNSLRRKYKVENNF